MWKALHLSFIHCSLQTINYNFDHTSFQAYITRVQKSACTTLVADTVAALNWRRDSHPWRSKTHLHWLAWAATPFFAASPLFPSFENFKQYSKELETFLLLTSHFSIYLPLCHFPYRTCYSNTLSGCFLNQRPSVEFSSISISGKRCQELLTFQFCLCKLRRE